MGPRGIVAHDERLQARVASYSSPGPRPTARFPEERRVAGLWQSWISVPRRGCRPLENLSLQAWSSIAEEAAGLVVHR